MFIDFNRYRNKRICVALSGGKDSMSLMHYLLTNASVYGITLSAINCDHAIRGEDSARDSAFVQDYCKKNGAECFCFKWQGKSFVSEEAARRWRYECYAAVTASGKADYIATAHHMNDNAETVLFNMARGASVSGLIGITDNEKKRIIRPMVEVTRAEIDEYVIQNAVPFVQDLTNFSNDYTRNKIRHNVLPSLEAAVPHATENIYRLSRLAAEDEEYFSRQVDKVLVRRECGYLIASCTEPVIFKRALRKILIECGKKDYTAAQMRTVYEMQWLNCGKKFSFLGLTVVREEAGLAVFEDDEIAYDKEEVGFWDYLSANEKSFCGRDIAFRAEENAPDGCALFGGEKILKFDLDKIPQTAVIRFKRAGDKFTKFGGGSKSLGDYLTDKKVPQSVRERLPLVCDGKRVLIVGGVEIADDVKITEETVRACAMSCADPLKI